jgi:outer membrane autotransporter protein
MSGHNTYSAPTHVTAGTILAAFSTTGLSPNSDFTIDNGGTLELFGSSSTIRSLSGAGKVSNSTAFPVSLTLGLPTGTATFSGSITDNPGGALSLIKQGGGTQILAGTSTYTGTTLVNGGTLQAGATGAFANASAFTVTGSATLDLHGFNQTIGSLAGAGNVTLGSGTLTTGNDNASTSFAGVISGAGGLTKIGGGTFFLTGNSTYTGGTTISAGTLQLGNGGAAGSILGNVLDNGAFVFDRSDSYTFAGAISGNGTVLQIGPGTTILTGNSTYAGPTNVNAGILEVNGSLVSAVTVNNGGTLEGFGTIGGLSVMSGGAVLPGDAIGTLNVSGNVVFAAGSTYLVEINAAGQGSKIAATGKATLNGGAVQVTTDPGTYNASLRYTILTANGSVTGTFASLSTTLNLAFLSPQLSYDANDVFLGFAQTVTPAGTPVTFPSVAITPNQAATAAAVQALGAGNPIFNAVLTQTVPGARQAFDALSGEIHASAVTAAFEDQRLPREAILDRLSQPAEQPVLGAATTMTSAYAADLPTRKPTLAPVAVQMVQPRLFGLWGQGFGDWGKTNGDHNAAKLSRDTGGFVIGADADRQFWNGDWRFGIAGGYTDDSLKVSARSSSGDYQSIFGALYGKASYGAIDVKAGVILASTDTHINRSIIFPGFVDAASGSYGGYAAQGFGEIGYNLPFHWTPWSYVPGLDGLKVNYEPFLQGAVIHIDQNRYAEAALTGAALVGAAKGYDLGTTTLGWRTQFQLASLPGFTLSTLLGWRHAFGDVRPSVTQSFAGSFASFTVAGVPIDRDALVSEASLNYAVTNSVTVGVSYSGQYGRRASDNAFKGHVDVSFW